MKVKFVKIAIFAFAIFLFVLGGAYGQNRREVYELPPKYASIMLVNDPDGPIQLRDQKIIGYVDGGIHKTYSAWNRSNKGIRSFVVKYLSWFNNNESTGYPETTEDDFFSPGETISRMPDQEQVRFIDFDEKLAKRSDLGTRPKDLILIMVVEAQFADGTKYEVNEKYRIIQEFVSRLKINTRLTREEVHSKEEELRQFIDKEVFDYSPNRK